MSRQSSTTSDLTFVDTSEDDTIGNLQNNENIPKSCDLGSGIRRRKTARRILHVKTKAPGTRYDILGLISDYRNIILCVNEHNKWIGKWMGGAQAANYAQFVSDVFIMIQVRV